VVVGYGLALAAFVFRIIGGDFTIWSELPGAIVIAAVVAVPPTLAALSMRNRPLLLLPAGVLGLAGALGLLSIFGFPLVILGLIWFWAYLKVAPRGHLLRKFGMVLVPLLWLGAFIALFVHLDPQCEQRLSDGTVQQVDPVIRGFESGWAWEVDTSTFSGGSGIVSADVEFEACSSDTVVPWEAALSMLLSTASVAVAWLLGGTTNLDDADSPREAQPLDSAD
jgi:hypothetical protein